MSRIFIDYDDLLDYINMLLCYTANLTREETLKIIKAYIIEMRKYQLSDELMSHIFGEEVLKSPTNYDDIIVDKLMGSEDDFDLHKIKVRWD